MRTFRFAVMTVPFAAIASAQAADLPRRTYAPPPVAAAPYTPPMFSWTGFYVGATAGYGWGDLGRVGNATYEKPSGFIGGITAGYNHQFDRFVIGIEGDLSWNNMDSSKREIIAIGTPAVDETVVNSASVDMFSTVRLRAGFALDRALVFATAGYAGASLETKYSNLTAGVSGSSSNWRHGWVVGGGIEYAITRNLSIKSEYLYFSLGSASSFPGTPYVSRAELSGSIVRAGVNYRF